MIPAAIFMGTIMLTDGTHMEIRALEFSTAYFHFRLPKSVCPKSGEDVCLSFFSYAENTYHDLTFRDYRIQECTENTNSFYTVYRFSTENPSYKEAAGKLSQEYLHYIQLKTGEEGAAVTKALTEYPVDESKTASSFAIQRQQFMHFLSKSFSYQTLPQEVGITLDQPEKWRHYMKMPFPEFLLWYFTVYAPGCSPVPAEKITHLYIGNSFCAELFPSVEELPILVEKLQAEKKIPVFVFSLMRQGQRKVLLSRIHTLHTVISQTVVSQKPLECEINDLGMLAALSNWTPVLSGEILLTLGIMPARRRKDVRLPWKHGFTKNDAALDADRKQAAERIFGKTATEDPLYRKQLSCSWNIKRFSYECCGYAPSITQPETATLYLPYYQMNTATNCTLYAECAYGSRGMQTGTEHCPGYCQKKAFLYPDDFHMVGYYNSLFGFDPMAMQEMQRLRDRGVKRICFNFL